MLSKSDHAPRVWIVSGPSGSGKTSLCDALLEDKFWQKRLLKSVSCTTRPMRNGEVEGKDYVHVTKEAFLKLIKNGALLEHEEIFGFYYGTPKSIINEADVKGRDLLLCIDVKGARSVRSYFGKKVASIFILPPDVEVLAQRLKKRSTENKKDIEKRLKRVKIELSLKKEYDYIVVNDDFDEALKKIKAILLAKASEGNHVLRTT